MHRAHAGIDEGGLRESRSADVVEATSRENPPVASAPRALGSGRADLACEARRAGPGTLVRRRELQHLYNPTRIKEHFERRCRRSETKETGELRGSEERAATRLQGKTTTVTANLTTGEHSRRPLRTRD